MFRLPADEDYARALLSIFQSKGVRPRESLPAEEVEAAFLNRNLGRADDFQAALAYAAAQRWISSGFDRIRLTGQGGDILHTIWMGRGQDYERPNKPPPGPTLPALKSRA